jgi:sucrose phosphorylase
MTTLKNKIQLIVYPDCIGHNLRDLKGVLDGYLADVVGGVHILPFYPSSGDRGFSPLTHLEVDKRFGTWDDVVSISKDYDLMVDLIVNHISSESVYFKDFIKNGDQSEWTDLFLDVDRLLKRNNETSDSVFEKTYRPRPSSPIKSYRLADGTTKRLWSTFTDQQVDLDITSSTTRALIESFVHKLIDCDVNIIRLDAIGYCIKKPNTVSFMLPETYSVMQWIKDIANPQDVKILAEVHSNYHKQLQLAGSPSVDLVYDFALPLLVLHAIYSSDSARLVHWIKIRPSNQVTTLDTHDGIGVVDDGELMNAHEIQWTISKIKKASGIDEAINADSVTNVDIYQINTTYYSALSENDDAYIVARAIQFFVPGIPQIYYVGLLAGANDKDLLNKTKNGRDINRHYYSLDEFKHELKRDVVGRLFRLMRFRNTYPAFNGKFTLEATDSDELVMRWDTDDVYCRLVVNLLNKKASIQYVNLDDGTWEHMTL